MRLRADPHTHISVRLRPFGAFLPISGARTARIFQHSEPTRKLVAAVGRNIHMRGAPAPACDPICPKNLRMFFKLFRKPPADVRPRFEQDPSLVEELERRVNAIRFQPTKGFLKDQAQPKRSQPTPSWTRK